MKSLPKLINELWNHICTPSGFFQLIMAVVAIIGVVVLIKRHKIDYAKPKIKISESYSTPPTKNDPDFFKSLIRLSISNPSKFENTICSFRLFDLRSFRLAKLIVEKEVDIKLPITSRTSTDIDIDFESTKDLRGKQAILCLTDIKGSKSKKKFIFMPSYKQKNV